MKMFISFLFYRILSWYLALVALMLTYMLR